MRVVFAGTPRFALPALRALMASDHEVIAVVTRPDARAGRGRRTSPSPVRSLAEEHDVPVLTPHSPTDPEFLQELANLKPDVCPVVAYGALIPQDALDIPTQGWINLHFSLLPAWRGAAPVQHAIMAGDEVTGATTFLLEAGLDTGPVFGAMTELIRPNDTAGSLLERLAEGGAPLLLATLDALASGQAHPVPQSSEGVSVAPKIDVADALVTWDQPAFAVDRRIRGCTPAPGAWTTFRDERLKLGPITLAPDHDHLAAGELAITKRDVHVGTATVPVRLGEVQPKGKSFMPAPDWARGLRLEHTEVLGS